MRLNVHVKADKSESKVIKKDFDEYEVWVKAPPIDGRANKEMIKTLANYFSVKKSSLYIVTGTTSPHKVVELTK
jgi:uncharacterized protein (TIGR00251 family)